MSAENPTDAVIEQAVKVAIEAFVLSDAEHEWTIPDTVRALHDAGLLAADPADRDELGLWEDWSNRLAEKMPPEYDGDEAQEAIIERWVDDLLAAKERAEAEVKRLRRQHHPDCFTNRPEGADHRDICDCRTLWTIEANPTLNPYSSRPRDDH